MLLSPSRPNFISKWISTYLDIEVAILVCHPTLLLINPMTLQKFIDWGKDGVHIESSSYRPHNDDTTTPGQTYAQTLLVSNTHMTQLTLYNTTQRTLI